MLRFVLSTPQVAPLVSTLLRYLAQLEPNLHSPDKTRGSTRLSEFGALYLASTTLKKKKKKDLDKLSR